MTNVDADALIEAIYPHLLEAASAAVREAARNQQRPTVRPGTVVGIDSTHNPPEVAVQMDLDPVAVYAQALAGDFTPGQRVMVFQLGGSGAFVFPYGTAT